MKRNKGLGFCIIVIVLVLLSLLSIFSLTINNSYGAVAFKIPGANDIRLGIDIRGGVEAVFEPENKTYQARPEELNSARAIIETRLDKNNITDRDVTVDYGKSRILVRFPWKSTETDFNPQNAIGELGQMGKLTFKYYNGNVILEGKDVSKSYFDTLSGQPVVQLEFSHDGAIKFAEASKNVVQNTIPSATASASASSSAETSAAASSEVSASPSAIVSSGALKPNATASASASSAASETVEPSQIAIYLDNKLISHPKVENIIADGKCYIENMGSVDEAKKLANLIASGSLPFKLISRSNNSISPTMGKNALNLMIISGLIAFIIVCIFMLIKYRLPGFIACLALIGQVAGSLLILSISQFTLTLPGIAGIILSIGMGVDANVIIGERIKEELYSGKTIRAAIDMGYKRAWATIFDSNATGAITAILLWILGTGTMISFGFTLFIGILLNFLFGVWATDVMSKSLMGLKFTHNKWLYGYDVKEEVVDNA